MTVDEKVKAFEMYQNGYSLAAIGREFGVSRQYIHQMLFTSVPSGKCVYPQIRQWCADHGVKYPFVAREINVSITSFYKYISGEASPKKDFIDKILQLTGMTYEEAFAREEV